jgi:hypothetical protein
LDYFTYHVYERILTCWSLNNKFFVLKRNIYLISDLNYHYSMVSNEKFESEGEGVVRLIPIERVDDFGRSEVYQDGELLFNGGTTLAIQRRAGLRLQTQTDTLAGSLRFTEMHQNLPVAHVESAQPISLVLRVPTENLPRHNHTVVLVRRVVDRDIMPAVTHRTGPTPSTSSVHEGGFTLDIPNEGDAFLEISSVLMHVHTPDGRSDSNLLLQYESPSEGDVQQWHVIVGTTNLPEDPTVQIPSVKPFAIFAFGLKKANS